MKDRRLAKGALVGAALGIASQADAAVFTVTNNADDGAGSLRQAIASANLNAGADVITFDASLSGSTITLATGEMSIEDSVDIQGLGSANLTVDANDLSRVFYVYNPAPGPIDVTISGIALVNGRSVVPGEPGASSGGAIRVVGENLALTDVRIENSEAGGDGGGVGFVAIESVDSYNLVPAVLSIQSSVLSGNSAEFIDVDAGIDQGGCGGAVFAAGVNVVQLDGVTLQNNRARCDGGGLFAGYFQEGGTLTIQSSVITGNDTGNVESGGGGGVALVNYGEVPAGSSASISDTTISGNSAVGDGGGLYVAGTDDVVVARTTISGNTASGGAGVMVYYSAVTLENVTVAENDASGWGGGVYGLYDSYVVVKETTVSGNTAQQDGPGLYAYVGAHFDVVNSIVANNGPGADLVDDGYSSDFTVAYTLVENEGTATINDGGGNLFGVDPQLGALQNNGGPTLTMKPASASQAVNAGDPAFAPPPSTDQRGFTRVVGGRIDMGAVEVNPGTLQFSSVAQNVAESAGTATVNVTRTGGTDGAVSAQVTVNGTSTATGGGADYTFAGATVNFADNSSTPQSVNVAIVDDPTDEPDETVILNLGTPAGGATIGAPAAHTITIQDNDVALVPGTLQFSIISQSVSEGAGTVSVQVTRVGGDDGAVSAQVTVDGTSTATGGGSDYTFAGATVNFADQSTTPQVINIPIVDDPTVEPNETVILNLGSPTGGATIGAPAQHTITIQDNDVLAPGTLQFSIISQSVSEGAGTVSVQVTRVGGDDGAVSAQVTVDGTSTATGGGSDYTFAGTTVNFADQSTTPQVINIPIVDDPTDEPSETVILNLGSPTGGATIAAPAQHTITILDNDLTADVSIAKTLAPGSLVAGETVTFNLVVSNSGPDSASGVTVTDTLPAQLSFVSATSTAGSCDSGPITITCNLGTLAPSGSATVTIVARMVATGPTTNTANVAAGTADPDSADNASSVAFAITAPVGIPTLDPTMQLLLAALVAAMALGVLAKRG